MYLVIVGKGVDKIVTLLEKNSDNVQIDHYEGLPEFVADLTSNALRGTIDRIILRDSVISANRDDEDQMRLLQLADMLLANSKAIRIVTLSKDIKCMEMFNVAMPMDTAVHVYLEKGKAKLTSIMLASLAYDKIADVVAKFPNARTIEQWQEEQRKQAAEAEKVAAVAKSGAAVQGQVEESKKTEKKKLGSLFGFGKKDKKPVSSVPAVSETSIGEEQAGVLPTDEDNVNPFADSVGEEQAGVDIGTGADSVVTETMGTEPEDEYVADVREQLAEPKEPFTDIGAIFDMNSPALETELPQANEGTTGGKPLAALHSTKAVGAGVVGEEVDFSDIDITDDIFSGGVADAYGMGGAVREVIKEVEVVKEIIKEVPVKGTAVAAPTHKKYSRFDNIVKGNEKITFVVTGERRQGVTSFALALAELCTKNPQLKVLFVDFDTKRKGSIPRMGLTELFEEPENIRKALGVIRDAKQLRGYTFVPSNGFKFKALMSFYGEDISVQQMSRVDEIIAYQDLFDVVIVDCPIENIAYLDTTLVNAGVLFVTDNDVNAVINLMDTLNTLGVPQKTKVLLKNRGNIIVNRQNSKTPFTQTLEYVAETFGLADEPINWSTLKVLGTTGNIAATMQKF